MLPGVSGFDFITKLSDTPIIFVTAKGELEHRLQSLELGAEDYIVKPFEMLELIARINILTPQEFSLLEILIINKNIALSGEKLLISILNI